MQVEPGRLRHKWGRGLTDHHQVGTRVDSINHFTEYLIECQLLHIDSEYILLFVIFMTWSLSMFSDNVIIVICKRFGSMHTM